MKNKFNFFKNEENDFQYEYIALLINRLTHSNMSLEIDLGNSDNSENAVRLNDNMEAFKYLLKNLTEEGNLTEDLIIKVADTVNESSIYISRGYRKINPNYISDTTIPITASDEIERDMKLLLNLYETTWSDLDPYEREALFHITFIRIHPFEDGNGRTSRLILNHNMLKQDLSPIIITTDDIDYYHTCIEDENIEGLTNLFYNQSQKEMEIINHFKSSEVKDEQINKSK